ncbi:RsiG family protein [Nocardioides sp. MAHUQ-72]|uniref:RsiG family protein n=1 Tax=unclassified Nocardioides TaxID=2615069 RepID=UPI003607E583
MSPQTSGDGRRRSVTSTVPSAELASLDLEQLRGYRHRLEAEEEKVSYWRRLVHARIDVLDAESGTAAPLSVDDLVRVLGDTGSGQTRRALVSFRAADPLPDLPVLSEMWVTEVDPHDEEQVADAQQRLRTAEQQLTAYRRALHERIDEATRELILRYRDNPLAALSVIPQE